MANIVKRVIVMTIAISMLVSGSGIGVFAESLNEGSATQAVSSAAEENSAKNGSEEADSSDAADKKADAQTEDADKAEKSDAKADADSNGTSDKETAGSDADSDSNKEEKAKDGEKELTADDWEAKLPSSLPSDIRDAAAAVAKSQLGASGDLYRAFANMDSDDKWDAAYALFVLNYAKILDTDKALGDSTKGTVTKNGKSIPVNADASKWISDLRGADLLSKADANDHPEKGDIVFVNGKTAAVTGIDGDTLTLAGAGRDGSNAAVSTFTADTDDIDSYVSIRDLAPEKFSRDSEDKEDAAEDESDKEDAEEADADDDKDDLITMKYVEPEEPVIPEEDEEGRALEDRTAEAEITDEPGVIGVLRSIVVKDSNPEITISGYMPEDAAVRAYPVSVEIPGQNVIVAYDITIYIPEKDENGELTGEETEWQPVTPLTVSVKDEALNSIENSVNVYHMEDADAQPEFVAETGVSGDEVSFDAEGFSIYVITTEPKTTYVFYNGDDEYSRQVLTTGQTLAEPASPTAEGRVFKHWSLSENGEEAYDKFGQPVTVDANGGGTIELHAVYDTQKYRITYYDQNGGIVETRMAAADETVDPSKVGYTPIQNEEGVHLHFLYWTEQPYGDKAEKKSFTPSKNVDLYPLVEAGHWIYFDVNKTAVDNNSTKYAASVFVKPGENNKPGTEEEPVSITSCKGYQFLGWFTKRYGGVQVFDGSGIRNEEGYAKITKNGELFSEPTLYAHWDYGNADYTVSYYVQCASDEVGGTKHYEFFKTADERRQAKTGTSVTYNSEFDTPERVFAADEKATDEEKTIAMQNQHGFKISDQNESVVVKSDGTTELQVRFDRKTFTLKLYNFAQKNNLIGSSNGIIDDAVVTDPKNSAYKSMPTSTDDKIANSQYATYDSSNEDYRYFWNIYSVKEIKALYGHDISDEFNVSVNYIKSYRLYGGTSISWGSYEGSSNLIAWYDANQTSHPTCGVNKMFRILYKMPSLYDTQLNDYDTEVLIHNCRITAQKKLHYYREEKKNSDHNYSDVDESDVVDSKTNKITDNTAIGKKYVSKTINGEKRYFELVDTSNHNYGKVEGWNSSALFQSMEGYENNPSNCWPAKLFEDYGMGDGKETPPTKSAVFYTLRSFDLILKDPTHTSDDESISMTFGEKISAEKAKTIADYYDKAKAKDGVAPIKDADTRGYWYNDENYASAFDFEKFVMPAKKVIIYAGVTNSYIVRIDPNGGELFGSNGSSLGNNYSTWFRANKGEYVSEYKNIERNYVKADPSEATHKYVVNEYKPGDTDKPRTATYEKTIIGADHKYEKGAYVLNGWVKVDNYKVDGKETEKDYHFNEQIESDLVLRAKWRRNANFRIEYDANADGIKAPVDNSKYEEDSHAIAAEALDAPAGKRFDCWIDDNGKSYRPGELILISEDKAKTESVGNMTITLKASYKGYDPESNIMADYTFMNGDDVYYQQTISEGEELVRPETPQKSGYRFKGWFRDSACTERFDGFGTINNPVYTTLYAGFEKAFTVTYYNDEDKETRTVIASQTYSNGDNLSTVGVLCDAPVGYIVTGWKAAATEEDEEEKVFKYNAFDGSYKVKGDMELIPILKEQKHLNFVSNGGSYIAPILIPDDRRPAMPREPERKGYRFTGWFTAKNLDPESMYDFDTELEAGVETLYAGWQVDEKNPATGKLTVAWWAQTPDRPEDADNDYDHYELVDTDTIEEFEVGTYSRAQIAEYFARNKNLDITSIDRISRLASRYQIKNVSLDPSKSEDMEKFRKFFEFNPLKSGGDVTVTDSGNHVLNIRFDRKEYTFKFTCSYLNYTGNAVEFSIHYHDVEYNNGQYSIKVWLDRKITDLWPTVSSAREKDINAAWIERKLLVQNGYKILFEGWKAQSDEYEYVTVQNSADAYMLSVMPASGTQEFKMVLKDTNNEATVHYILDGVEDTDLQQPIEFSAGNMAEGELYTPLKAKTIKGYTSETENPVYSTDANGAHLTFNYTSNEYKVNLYENATDLYKVVDHVKYNRKIDGEDGILAGVPIPEAPEGKRFKCWAASPNVDTAYTGNMPDYDITLYAIWEDIRVTVTTKLTDAEGNIVTEEYGEFLYNTKFKEFGIPDPDTEDEYFFGWQIEGSDSGMIDPDSRITTDITVVPVTKLLAGKTITYDANDGSGYIFEDLHKYAVGAKAIILSGAMLRKTLTDIDGKEYQASFVCWNTQADGKGLVYYPGNYIEITGDITLYAIYSSKRQTEMFYVANGNGAEFVAETEDTELDMLNSAVNTIRVLFNDDLDLTVDSLIGHPNSAITIGHDNKDQGFFVRRPGYKFDNWSTASNATDGEFENGMTAYVNTIGEGNNLYAIWDEDRLPIQVYEYIDEDIDNAQLLGGSQGGYLQEYVNESSKDAASIEGLYRAQVQKEGGSYQESEEFAYEKAMIDDEEVDALQYVLSEDGRGYEWQYHVKDTAADSFKVVSDKDTLTYYYHKCTTGDLYISNAVSGLYADQSKEFEFTLNVEGADADKEFEGTILNENSSTGDNMSLHSGDTFRLRHGQELKINLPRGKKITITETPADGYTAAFSAKSCATRVDETVENGIALKLNGTKGYLNITNEYNDQGVVESGIEDHNGILALLLILVIFAEWIIITIRRRRNHRHHA